MTPALVESEREIDAAANAAERVCDVHEHLAGYLRAGLTLAEVDAEVGRTLEKLGASSCFRGYRVPRTPPFPCHACLSVNECVVHGKVDSLGRPLEEGDLISVDVGVRYRGWIGDAAWTYAVGTRGEEAERLMACGKESLLRGVEELRAGNILHKWAEAVSGCVDEYGYYLVQGLGGHGYGKTLHAPPFVSNIPTTLPWEWREATWPCKPGMLLAVEPMVAVSTGRTRQARGDWPIFTADGSLSVHYEADVLVTEEGPRNLTARMNDLPDVVG